MKQIFTILFITLLLLNLGCKDDRLELPEVKAIPSQLNLTSNHPTEQITLIVNSGLNLQWSVSYQPNWLSISPASGNVDGSSITVTALTSTLLPQTLTDKIIIKTTTGKIEIPVVLTIASSNAVQLTPSPLLLDFTENSKTATIKNNSNQPVNWQLEPSAAYLNIAPSSGTLNANQSSNLTLSVNRSSLDSKIYSETLALKLGGLKIQISLLR